MNLLAIDPGDNHSAYLIYDTVRRVPLDWFIVPNTEMLTVLSNVRLCKSVQSLVVEMIASYGMPVGREVFDTCLWIGRFIERWGGPHQLVYRGDVKDHLCHSRKATDANVRQALIDRYGPGKARAVGLKKTPGPLYGIKRDGWAALAVAVTAADAMTDGPQAA